MSLTSFLENKDVKEKFQEVFKKPPFNLQTELQAQPLTKDYGLVGTAFDYLLRFYIEYLNPHAVTQDWISQISLQLLAMTQESNIFGEVNKIVQEAKKIHHEFIKKGSVTPNLLKIVISLAKVDMIYRVGKIDEGLDRVDERNMEDLKNLISIVKLEFFKTAGLCILNPTFNKGSQLVGGADVDLVIDDAIIDIKTTIKLELSRKYFNQLVGYYVLYKIGGIHGMPQGHEIKRLGIYFSRHAQPWYFDIGEIINENTFPHFIKWFTDRAYKEYGMRSHACFAF